MEVVSANDRVVRLLKLPSNGSCGDQGRIHWVSEALDDDDVVLLGNFFLAAAIGRDGDLLAVDRRSHGEQASSFIAALYYAGADLHGEPRQLDNFRKVILED